MRRAILVLVAMICSCSKAPPTPPLAPATARLVADGAPVAGAAEPEVVRLRKIEDVGRQKHVTVGNVAGEYVLVCNPDANKDYGVKSCLSPRSQMDYLLVRENTRWLRKGAKEPVDLKFMEDFSVEYQHGENVGLMSAKDIEGENFGVYWLPSWTAANSATRR